MSLLAFTGFDLFPDLAGMGQFFSSVPSGTLSVFLTNGVGRYGHTGCYQRNTSGSSSGYLGKTLASGVDTIIVGVAYKPSGNNASRPILTLREGATTHIELESSTSNVLQFTRAGTIIGPSAPGPNEGTWGWIEVKVTIHDTAGTIECRLNGTVIISATSLDTRNGGTGIINEVIVGGTTASDTAAGYYDDLVILDTTGAAPHNDFLGDVGIYTLSPTAAGSVTQWTPSAGSNYACVDELPSNTTDYVEDSTAGHQDLYEMGSIGSVTGTVHAVKVTAVAQKSDSGSTQLKLLAKSGATTSASAAKALAAASYTQVDNIWIADPATGVAWTISAVDALQAGIEVA